MDEEAFREELRQIYDAAYAKKHPPKEEPPDTGGGVREPRRPRPAKPSGEVALDPVSVT